MTLFKIKSISPLKTLLIMASFIGGSLQGANAEVTLEKQVKISDEGLHFNGKSLDYGNLATANTSTDTYDYFFGRNISAHGDSVKPYKNYVFMTWYRGGKDDRHVMLSRYNTTTGVTKTIEFPHKHTGFRGDPNIGESHNTIGLAVSPINGTIHMVFDMHAYDDNNHGGKFKNDYFRYSFSVAGAADVPDEQFTLDQFVKDTSSVSQGPDDYKHLTMTGNLADKGNFARLTYPKFFENTDGTLLLYMRLGGNNNGGYVFNRYDATTQKWSKFTAFNVVTAKNFGNDYNWGLYGNMKYVNGKLRVGFQQRSSDNNDRYTYQNGVYYAYSDHPEGNGDWKNHKGESMTFPLVNSDEIKVFEPGDFISHTEANSVYIVGDFDWTVTEKGDVHIISLVRSTNKNRPDYEEVYIHSYKPAGAEEFIHSTDFGGATEIYTAGDNVYIVGLNSSGYPYVEKTIGGTNNFVRVYEATEGIQFDHGTIDIKDGKVYYYLMERGEGTAMPLHLQIIDLDLESDALKPSVSFPSANMSVNEGYEQLSFGVVATSPDENRSIVSVDLFVDDNFIRTDSADPFVWGHKSKPNELLGLTAGTHTFKAIATDSEGLTGVATMTLEVLSNRPIVTFPESTVTVEMDYTSLKLSVTATSPIEGRSISKVDLYANDTLIRSDNSVPYLWGHNSKPAELLGLPVGVHTFTAVATDSEGLEGQSTMTLIVKGLEQVPTVVFPDEIVTVFEGYEKLAVTIQAESPMEGRSVVSVTLYKNGELVRVDTRPVWNFGHSLAPYELGAMGWLDTHSPNPNPLGVGSHTFKAVAKDSTGLEGEGYMTLIVKPLPAPTINFIESDIELTEGYTGLSLSVDIETATDDIDLISVGLYLDEVLIRELYEAPFTWGDEFNANELLAIPAGSHVFKAVVTDSNNRTSEATVLLDVAPKPMLGDLDGDLDVDTIDMRLFRVASSRGELTDMALDFNNDGRINSQDLQGLSRLCTRSRCASE
ncbi:MAG: BNR-4 repeat-containing protein [Paraglaciecola sp.]|uniref:BNR-4 repeat-containing protein n=1 Tax=Paraglaciecola sp. TaxID=1920173 RepID=UPI00273FC2C5|nr:BNR-4 repeat-containing protein [Paraglaciecola sp.]MDP5030936.1 BNR-4 repeat-containing protein [Paraglaciecola sp.]MDP5130929.1 BNR-4 repeat-containing protein [Paraglaciecola sp.]